VRIGILGREQSGSEQPLVDCVADAERAVADGFATFWLPQAYGLDALMALAIVGRAVGGIELGTAVMPIYARTPVSLASSVLTTQAAVGGRFTLGIGLSHQPIIEGSYGLSFDQPVRHMREYLEALLPLVREGAVSFAGDTVTARIGLDVRGSSPVRVVLAALGPKMLELAGGMADGTATWMTGPATLADHVVPTIRAAAEAAGRPAPVIGAGFPVCVTDDPAGARAAAAETFAIYGSLPSYRAMLDREGADGPADIAIVGDEAAVGEQLARLSAIGVTEFIASTFGTREERDRTFAFLRSAL